MAIKCDYKFADNTFLISAPRGLDVLPGRMLRRIMKNLEDKYQLSEYSFVKGRRAAEMKEDVISDVALRSGTGAFVMGNQPMVVFQKLHPSIYDPDFIQLTDDETMDFQSRLPDDEAFNYEDFTVAMTPDYFIAVAVDVRKLSKVLDHLRLESFEALREAVGRLCPAAITIYDEADMFVQYTDKTLPAIFTEGLEEWLNPPEEVESLDF